jgi:hypothetical protein
VQAHAELRSVGWSLGELRSSTSGGARSYGTGGARGYNRMGVVAMGTNGGSGCLRGVLQAGGDISGDRHVGGLGFGSGSRCLKSKQAGSEASYSSKVIADPGPRPVTARPDYQETTNKAPNGCIWRSESKTAGVTVLERLQSVLGSLWPGGASITPFQA